jgi:mRNA-degrading endonuclease RelE of RelBE toxin-antitoxin system
MTWTIRVAKPAQKSLSKAPGKSRRLIAAALLEMQDNPFSGDIVRLVSERSTWRRRAGAYRIFFDVYPEMHHIDVVDISRRTSTTYK